MKIENEIDPCENIIYRTYKNEQGNSFQMSLNTLSKYLKENQYSKNTMYGEIYSFTGMEKIKVIKDAYIQGYRDALENK